MKIPLDLNPGDFLDRLSIAAIRHAQVKTLGALTHLQQLDRIFSTAFTREQQKQVMPLVESLRKINQALWGAEDLIRRLDTGYSLIDIDAFLTAAQQTYLFNDQRSRLKKEIDQMFGETPEEKSYAK